MTRDFPGADFDNVYLATPADEGGQRDQCELADHIGEIERLHRALSECEAERNVMRGALLTARSAMRKQYAARTLLMVELGAAIAIAEGALEPHPPAPNDDPCAGWGENGAKP